MPPIHIHTNAWYCLVSTNFTPVWCLYLRRVFIQDRTSAHKGDLVLHRWLMECTSCIYLTNSRNFLKEDSAQTIQKTKEKLEGELDESVNYCMLFIYIRKQEFHIKLRKGKGVSILTLAFLFFLIQKNSFRQNDHRQ